MKQLITLVFFLISFGFPGNLLAQTTDTTQTKKTQKKETTVYITKTGTKYHKSSCGYLHSSKIETTLTKAKEAEYGPCSRCFKEHSGSSSTAKPKTIYSGRCNATTKAGTQCKRNTSSGSRYCWQHQ